MKRFGRRVQELLSDNDAGGPAIPEVEGRVHETRRRIERLVAALAAGSDDLPSVRSALAGLEREREGLEHQIAHANERMSVRENGREDLIAALRENLSHVRDVLAVGSAEEQKASSVKLVAVGGIEPPTRGL